MVLELDEFMKGISILFLSKGYIKEKLEYLFDFYDSNFDGQLSLKDIMEGYKAIYSMLGNKNCDLICKHLADEALAEIQFYTNMPDKQIRKGIRFYKLL
jgi:Ca2+-binding EF-hand superfamily protein